MNWYMQAWKKYADFNGRATRQEYWWFYIWNMVVVFALAGIDTFLLGSNMGGGVGFTSGLYSLAVFIPSLSVTARRLHDTNRSGWWMFISLVPLVGAITLLVFLLQDSKGAPRSTSFAPERKAA